MAKALGITSTGSSVDAYCTGCTRRININGATTHMLDAHSAQMGFNKSN